MVIFIACVVGLGVGLFSINYWHATKCASDRSHQEVDTLVDALNRRLLQAESQVFLLSYVLNHYYMNFDY